jgi:D-lyxose ketol-isomerase
VRNGACFIEVDGKKKKLKSMDWVEIAPRTKHRFWNSSKSVYCFITEVSTHHDDKDVVRLEPSKRL